MFAGRQRTPSVFLHRNVQLTFVNHGCVMCLTMCPWAHAVDHIAHVVLSVQLSDVASAALELVGPQCTSVWQELHQLQPYHSFACRSSASSCIQLSCKQTSIKWLNAVSAVTNATEWQLSVEVHHVCKPPRRFNVKEFEYCKNCICNNDLRQDAKHVGQAIADTCFLFFDKWTIPRLCMLTTRVV